MVQACRKAVKERQVNASCADTRVLEALPDGAPHCVFGEALGLPEAVLQQTLDLRDTAAGRPACLPAGR